MNENNHPPTYAQIGDAFSLSIPSVQSHLNLIEKKGFIKRQGARGIQILKAEYQQSIPIIGSIAAGAPTFAVEDYIGTINDIPELQQKNGRIALTVKGDSMINAHIDDGDIAIIQPNVSIKTNDIVAAYIDEEATLKRIEFGPKQILLHPENDAYTPITLQANHQQSHIIGKMIALIRCQP